MALINIGETGTLADLFSGDNGYNVAGLKIVVPQTLTLLSLSKRFANAAGDVRLGFYDDDGIAGLPGTLLAETASASVANGINTLATLTSPSITAGNYWIAWQINSATVQVYQQHGVLGDSCYYATAYAAFDATFNATPATDNVYYNIYATFDDGASGDVVGEACL